MDIDAITDEHAARVTALDPLLAVPPPFPAGAAVLTAGAGAAVASYQESAVGTDRTWQPARRHRLDVRLAGEDRAADLGGLLDQWLARLDPAAPGDLDSAAVVETPSRDTEAVPALIHRGFVPVAVVAVRRAGRAAPAAGVVVRQATPADLAAAVALNMEVVHYDAAFGKVTPRSDTARMLANDLAATLAEPSPPVWLAELDGRAVGFAYVQLPPVSDWSAGYTRVGPVGYFACLSVTARLRGGGVGSALAAHAHGVLDAAGLPVTVLHHALPNPRSTPFWYRHGYRPLWTTWYRRPALSPRAG